MKKVAVILAGCGYLDGAEIRESVLTLLALENAQVPYQIFAPNKDQHHVVNHLSCEEEHQQSRNVLEEAARIARGDISDLSLLKVKEFAALILPGGFGAAKNLSNFAFHGHNASMDELVAKVISKFHQSHKVIGGICISPALIALTLGKSAPVLTIGTDTGTATELEKLGAIHQLCTTSECVVDEETKIVTTPAYMDANASLPEVNSGINKLVKAVIDLMDY